MKNRRLTSPSTISYVLAPRINAAGRMGKAELAAELFLTKDPVRAQALPLSCEQNKLRQNRRTRYSSRTLTRLRREYNPLEDKIIVLAGGLASGRYRHRCARGCATARLSVVLISVDEDGVGKGSGRSIGSFNLLSAHLVREDGSERATAVMRCRRTDRAGGQIEELRTRLRKYAEKRMSLWRSFVPQAAHRLHGAVGVADEHRIP